MLWISWLLGTSITTTQIFFGFFHAGFCLSYPTMARRSALLTFYSLFLNDFNSQGEYKGHIMGAILTIVFMTITVLVVTLLRTPVNGSTHQIDIKDIINGKFSPKTISPVWLENGDFLYEQNKGDGRLLMRYNIATHQSTLFLNTSSLSVNGSPYGSTFNSFSISPDQSLVLFSVKAAKQFRSSFFAQWIIYNVHTGTSEYLLGGVMAANPTWNPVPQFADTLAIVVDNNVVIISKIGTTNITSTNVTSDGSSTMFNGMMDWLYEEEVFESSPALYWSPNGEKLAYLKLNDSLVGEVPYPWFPSISKSVYPSFKTVRYPKSGTPNPIASVHVYKMSDKSTLDLNLLADSEYVTNVAWVSTRQDQLSVRVLPRVQQVETILLFNAESGAQVGSLVSQNMTAYGWVESRPYSYIWVDADRVVDIRVHNDYYHVALMSFKDGSVKFLTSGAFSVMEIFGYDATSGFVYYLSTEKSEISRMVYRVNLQGERTLLTGNSPAQVFNVRWGSGDVYILDGSSSKTPPTQWVVPKRGEFTWKNKLKNNDWLLTMLETHNMPTKTFVKVPGAYGDELNVALIHPYEALKGVLYPALFTYYQGPTSNRVLDSWALGFNEWISTRSKMIVAIIDGAGTAAKSVSFNQQTFKRLGIRETEDQLAAIRHLLHKRSDMDWNRVGCWGWSYGGFMTLNLILRSNHIFNAAMSVAPVTDWKLYDTFYTERYMLTPEANPVGYNETSMLQLLAHNSSHLDIGFQNKTHLYLVHGIADDNVHFQNSADFVSEMVRQDSPLSMAYYPNQAHSISGDGSLLHLYHGLRYFLKENVIDFLYYDLHPDS